jgi:hypothetical protein
VVLATLGKRESDASRGLQDLANNEKVPVRWQALGVAVRAVLIGIAAAIIAFLA